ncbi:hypothetical protein PFISCL1PPCAC_2016, partial [Pristionchus fissidentatus]
MKLKPRMCFFVSLLLCVLLFIFYPIQSDFQLSHLAHVNYFNDFNHVNDEIDRFNVSFTQIAESLLLQFSFDDHRRGNMGPRSLRMLFLAKKTHPNLTCIFSDEREIDGTWYDLSENHGEEYGAYILSCAVPPNMNYLKTFAISAPNKEWISRQLSVDYMIPEREPTKFRWDYAICSPLVFGPKYTKEHLVEFIEMNKLLGVQKISIYVDKETVSKDFLHAVTFYQKQGCDLLLVFTILAIYFKN